MKAIIALALILLATSAASAEVFDSGNIAPGASFSFRFMEVHPEGYSYHCHPHPWMTAMVHVGSDTDGRNATHVVEILEDGPSDEWRYSIEHLMVEVGDIVIWTNEGNNAHTVTDMPAGERDHDSTGEHGHDTDHDSASTHDSPGAALALLVAAIMIALLSTRKP